MTDKMNKKLSILTLLILFIIFHISCKSDENIDENDTINIGVSDTSIIQIESDISVISDTLHTISDDILNQTKYICPMGHKEGNINEPGICPVCEMELIENPDYINEKSK